MCTATSNCTPEISNPSSVWPTTKCPELDTGKKFGRPLENPEEDRLPNVHPPFSTLRSPPFSTLCSPPFSTLFCTPDSVLR